MQHKNLNVRIPLQTKSRHTLYIDESGTSSLKEKERYYILTSVVATNHSFENVEEFYENLKRKYFGYIQHIHSVELFSEDSEYIRKGRAQLFRIKKYRGQYIKELSYFLDSIPFVFETVIINKRAMLAQLNTVKISNPWATTIGKANEIFIESGKSPDEFKETKISELLPIIGNYKILPIDYFRPLEMAYKEVLQQHLKNYYKNIYLPGSKMQICIESSTDQTRMLKLTENFKQETDKVQPKSHRTQFAKNLASDLYCLSFPNKTAKYLGLEIADLISYGYYLSSHHRRSRNTLYVPIWNVIQKRRREIEGKFGIKCVTKR